MLSKITDINLLIIQLAIALIEHKVESQNTEPQTTEGQYKKGWGNHQTIQTWQPEGSTAHLRWVRDCPWQIQGSSQDPREWTHHNEQGGGMMKKHEPLAKIRIELNICPFRKAEIQNMLNLQEIELESLGQSDAGVTTTYPDFHLHKTPR